MTVSSKPPTPTTSPSQVRSAKFPLPAVFVFLIAAVVAVIGFTNGELAVGFGAAAVGVLVLVVTFVAAYYDGKETDRMRTEQSALYDRWHDWVRETYGVDLSDEQNDELVNAHGVTALQSKAMVWGETTVLNHGVPLTVRLVGDTRSGEYHLVQVGADGGTSRLVRLV